MEKNLADIEACFIRIKVLNEIVNGEYGDFISCICRGQYQEALTLEFIKCLVPASATSSPSELTDVIVKQATNFIQESTDEDKAHRQVVLLALAVCYLQLYAQYNWTGPKAPTVSETNDELADSLTVDGETIYIHSSHVEYLCIARALLLDARGLLEHCMTAPWWLMRCLQLQQALLDERSPTLLATITDVIQTVSKCECLMASDKYRDLAIQFHLEAGHLYYFYYEPSKAEYHFRQAEKITGLKIELTGVMGKRTRFQEKELAQLVLSVERTSEAAVATQTCQSDDDSAIPKNVPMDDDTVLEEIDFDADGGSVCQATLCAVEQAVVLGLCYHHRKSKEGHGDIIREECLAYIDYVLKKPTSWCVQSSALFQRTSWENESLRRMQRSMMQLEELVNQWGRDKPSGSHRLPLLYAVPLPPIWNVQRELGNFLMKIGAASSALEVYLRLKLWEDVIQCYTVAGRREKAEEVIREQLAVKETPSLWCYLGDVTHDAEYYEKAWELSNHHSARAQRSLGYLYLNKGQYEESLPYFEKTLGINALQVRVWFSYGCAALAARKFDVAAKAFRRCVNLTYDNFEAWCNLASAYTYSNQKPRAFLALQEALKCEYENWRVWENFLLVSTDIGEFKEAMRAYHRLLDLRHKHSDPEVLKVLVDAVNGDIQDVCGEPSSIHRPALLQLLGRITSLVTSEAKIWRLYAELVKGGADNTAEDHQKIVQCLQKAHRCSIQKAGWEKDIENCAEVAKQGSQLLQACIECSEKVEVPLGIQILSSARLSIKGVLTKIQQCHTDPATKQILEVVKETCLSLEADLNQVSSSLQQLKGS